MLGFLCKHFVFSDKTKDI